MVRKVPEKFENSDIRFLTSKNVSYLSRKRKSIDKQLHRTKDNKGVNQSSDGKCSESVPRTKTSEITITIDALLP